MKTEKKQKKGYDKPKMKVVELRHKTNLLEESSLYTGEVG